MFSQQRSLHSSRRTLVSGRRSSVRLSVESLEDRLAPATYTWDGSASGLWSADANWVGNDAPNPGEANVELVFPTPLAANPSNSNDIAGLKVKSIQFNVGGYTLGGLQAITLNGSITNAAGANSITFGIKLSGNVSVSSAAATTLTLSGILSGTGGMTQSGAGTVELAGTSANTYTGTTRVNDGTLDLQKTSGVAAIVGPLVIGDGVLGVGDGVRLETGSSNQIADTAKITINGGAFLSLNGNNETIGPLTLAGGTVVSGLGTLTLAGNVVVKPSGNDSLIAGLSNLGAASRTFNVSTGANLEIAANITSAAGVALNKTGSGLLELSGANAGLLGAVNVSAGTLAVQTASALGAATTGTTVNKGATLRLDLAASFSEPLTLSGRGFAGKGALDAGVGGSAWTGPITLNKVAGEGNAAIGVEAGTLMLNTVLSGTAGLNKTGPANLELTGSAANTYAGTTTVKDGTLTLNKSSGVAIPAGLVIGDDSGTDSVLLSVSNQIADTALVEVNLSGTLNLNSLTETVTGLTADGGNVSIGTGSLELLGNVTVPRSSNIVATSGNLTLEGAAHTISVAKSKSLVIGAKVIDGTGPAGITKSGAGELVLQNDNTYTGITTVAAGVLSIGDSDGLGGVGAAARTEVKAGATLQLNGFLTNIAETLTLFGGGILRSTGGSSDWDGPITLTATAGKPRPVVRIDLGLALDGVISGTGGFSKTGAAALSLSGTAGNTYTGATYVLEGDLILSKSVGNAISGDLVAGDGIGIGSDAVIWLANNQVADSADVLVKSTGVLDLNSFSDTVDALTVQVGGVVEGGTLTVI